MAKMHTNADVASTQKADFPEVVWGEGKSTSQVRFGPGGQTAWLPSPLLPVLVLWRLAAAAAVAVVAAAYCVGRESSAPATGEVLFETCMGAAAAVVAAAAAAAAFCATASKTAEVLSMAAPTTVLPSRFLPPPPPRCIGNEVVSLPYLAPSPSAHPCPALQVVNSLQRIAASQGVAAATRVDPGVAAEIQALLPEAQYNAVARVLVLKSTTTRQQRLPGTVAMIAAGTANPAVVEECRLMLSSMGIYAFKLAESGVMGMHR